MCVVGGVKEGCMCVIGEGEGGLYVSGRRGCRRVIKDRYNIEMGHTYTLNSSKRKKSSLTGKGTV